MQRIVMAWAALSLGIVASPLAAQQAGGTAEAQLETRYLQSVPPAPPPPRARYVAPKPPPFPPMPRTAPKKRSTKAVTVHRSSPKATARRHETSKHAATKHAASKRHQAASKRHDTRRARTVTPAKVHLSKKTIRQCHAMSYSQILGHKNCRALMKQELSAADQKHQASKRKAKAAKHKAPARKAKAKSRRRH
jgi:hypothetical protein